MPGSVRVTFDELRDAGVERLPGERRYAARRRAAEQGIPLNVDDWTQLRQHAMPLPGA